MENEFPLSGSDIYGNFSCYISSNVKKQKTKTKQIFISFASNFFNCQEFFTDFLYTTKMYADFAHTTLLHRNHCKYYLTFYTKIDCISKVMLYEAYCVKICARFWLCLAACKHVFPLRYSDTHSTSANYLLLYKSAGSCCYGM